ncbi:MAG: hypothetical protein AB1725_11005 [Armatimonadota bacterium]
MRKTILAMTFATLWVGASAQLNTAHGVGVIDNGGAENYFALNLVGVGERAFGFVAFSTGTDMDATAIFAFATGAAWENDRVAFTGMGVLVHEGRHVPVTIRAVAIDGGEGDDSFGIAAFDENGNELFAAGGVVVRGDIVISSR